MNRRQLALRICGLAVAAIVLMAAAQLLLISFETEPLLSADRVRDLADRLRRAPAAGPGILAAIALIGLGAALAWSLLRSLGPDRRVITTRRRAGWTKFDRATLEDAIERRVAGIDQRADIEVRVTRRGRVDATIVTPDPTPAGPVLEIREAVDGICVARSLPARSGRFRVTVPRSIRRRAAVR